MVGQQTQRFFTSSSSGFRKCLYLLWLHMPEGCSSTLEILIFIESSCVTNNRGLQFSPVSTIPCGSY